MKHGNSQNNNEFLYPIETTSTRQPQSNVPSALSETCVMGMPEIPSLAYSLNPIYSLTLLTQINVTRLFCKNYHSDKI